PVFVAAEPLLARPTAPPPPAQLQDTLDTFGKSKPWVTFHPLRNGRSRQASPSAFSDASRHARAARIPAVTRQLPSFACPRILLEVLKNLSSGRFPCSPCSCVQFSTSLDFRPTPDRELSFVRPLAAQLHLKETLDGLCHQRYPRGTGTGSDHGSHRCANLSD